MGLDVARALAVLGMVGAHIGVTADEFQLLDPSTWNVLVHGRSSILFAVLAGVSISLMTGRTRVPPAAELPALRLNLIGRGAAVFLVGIALELLGTPIAVILTVYGLLYVAAVPFLRWRPGQLLLAAGILAVAGPPVLAGLRAVTLGPMAPGIDLVLFGTYPITVWMSLVLGGMAIGRLRLTSARVAGVLVGAGLALSVFGYGLGALGAASAVEEGSSGSSWSSGDSSVEVPSTVPADEIDLDGAVCEDWGSSQYYCYPAENVEGSGAGSEPGSGSGVILEDGQAVGEGWGAYPQRLDEQQPLEAMVQSIFAVAPHSGGTAEILGSGGFAVVIIGLCLLLSRPLRWLLVPLAALGAMPLTAYSAHVVGIVMIASPGGLVEDVYAWGWFALVLVAGAVLWAACFGQGPLERLVARLARAMSRGSERSWEK